MRFKNRAFALIWIVLSAILCCVLFSQYEKNVSETAVSVPAVVQVSPIDKVKLSIFLMFVAMLSLSMGVFFFAYSDELETYIGNYKRTKEI